MRLKNLSPNYLDNRNLDDYETQIRALCRENFGMHMIFMVCDHLREQIGEINDKVVEKFQAIMDVKNKVEEDMFKVSKVERIVYTPVNQDTFGKWCNEWLADLAAQEEKAKTDQDNRKTGK